MHRCGDALVRRAAVVEGSGAYVDGG